MAPSRWDNHIPSVLLHLTLRFTFLRIVCLTSLLLLIANIWQKAFENIQTYISLVVFVHHFATAFGPRLSLPGGLDLALVLTEVPLYNPGLQAINRWSTKLTVFTGSLSWATTISLTVLAALRIAEAFKKGWSFLWRRYDITAPEYRHAWQRDANDDRSDGAQAVDHGERRKKTLNTNDVLFGRSIWKSLFLGETYWIIISRGIFAAILIVCISLIAVYLVVLEPVRETAVTPVKESRTLGFPPDFETTGFQLWNVVIARARNKVELLELEEFASAIKVEVLQLNDNKTNCPLTDYEDSNSRIPPNNQKEQVALDFVTFGCPLFGPEGNDQGTYDDILVTVNFTMLNISADLAAMTRWNSVQVFLGRTDTSVEVIRRTPSTSLIPGVNLIGFGQRQLRQVFYNPMVSAFGLFDTYMTFITSEIVHVWHDPRAETSPVITRGPDVSTLRIIAPYDFMEWRIVQQSRDKSVLKGFASIGGLWTFLGGIFTAVFGTSIMRIIFGSKPISVFGLTRSFVGDKIKEAYRTEYPRMESDLTVPSADKGLIAFMADNLVDFDFLVGEGPDSHSPALNMDIEGKDRNSDDIPLLPVVANDTVTAPSPRSSHEKALSD